MAVSSGFFNSLNHDRRYDAKQFGSIFEGIIVDGILMSVGDRFVTRVGVDMNVIVGSGRAWFDLSWTVNPSDLVVIVPASNPVLSRIDMIVIETNWEDSVRKNDVKLIQGTPSSTPVRPTPIRSANVNQYPIAYITVPAGATSITAANIQVTVGTGTCPYATSPLKSISVDELYSSWQAQWEVWINSSRGDFDRWYNGIKNDLNALLSNLDSETTDFIRGKQAEFNAWFANLQAVLDGDVATHLAGEIADLQSNWKRLAREYTVLDTIDDHDSDPILDEDGQEIYGDIIYVIRTKEEHII